MKRQILFLTLAGALVATLSFAQQPKKVTEKFFPDPNVEMNIPIFAKKSGYTTYKEMMEFLTAQVAAHPSLLKMEIVGQTQKRRDIPLITVSLEGGANKKMRIFYIARVHGDEPAGTEGMLYLIRQLAEDESLRPLLEKADFYIMPMVNIDGAESSNRVTANGIDLNRDQSKLDSPEAVALQVTAHRVNPHVSVDFHEYQPIRSDFSVISSDILSTPWDVMFLYSSNPNVPQVLRSAVKDMFIANAAEAMDKHNLTHHTYYTSTSDFGQVQFNVGGASPRSSSNMFALKNTLSMLMETRGIKLDRVSMKRRVFTVYELAVSFATTTCDNADHLRKVLSEAMSDKGDIAVKFSSEKTVLPFMFIDIIKNDLVTFDVQARIAENYKVTLSRPLPKAYYISANQTEAAEKLKVMGVEVETLAEDTMVDVEAFTVTSMKESGEQVGGSVYPVDVKTKVAEKSMSFPAGTYRVPANQAYVRMATILLEPESSNGFVNYRVVKVAQNEEIPIYREK